MAQLNVVCEQCDADAVSYGVHKGHRCVVCVECDDRVIFRADQETLDRVETAPDASILISVYSHDQFDDCITCVDHLRQQNSDSHAEIIVLANDTNENADDETMYDRLAQWYADDTPVRIFADTEDRSLASARNYLAHLAGGDVYVFIDDDAVPATDDWLDDLLDPYADGEIAVGGPALARWRTERPAYLPDEMMWLVGVHDPPEPSPQYVRNTYGCNISFSAEAFDAVGGFDESLGKDNGTPLQAEETDLCVRLYEEYGQRVRYVPRAAVLHAVDSHQTTPKSLLERAFWQGVSKAGFDLDAESEEVGYLADLFMSAIPRQLSRGRVMETVGTLALTASVGAGYFYGHLGGRA